MNSQAVAVISRRPEATQNLSVWNENNTKKWDTKKFWTSSSLENMYIDAATYFHMFHGEIRLRTVADNYSKPG